MEARPLLIVLLVAVVVSGVSSSDESRIFPRQHGRPKPGGSKSPPPPPPVDASFRTSCTEQQRRSPGIRCEGNGTFSLLQCMGRRCFCVAPETGERINTETFPKGQENTMPCSTGSRVCANTRPCKKVCADGYEVDENMCQTCTCNPMPRVQSCPTIRDLVVNDMCSCQCVLEPLITPPSTRATTLPTPTDTVTVMATEAPPTTSTSATIAPASAQQQGMEDTSSSLCPSCNTTCSSTSSDRTCAVSSQDQCRNGTTLVSVGRHGRPECASDLSEQEKCTPEDEPKPMKKKVSGASRRSRAGDVKQALPPCATSLVCKAVEPKKYACLAENRASPCVMARRSASSLRCDPEGNFRPQQCQRATLISESTTSPPSVGPEATGNRSPEECRCVYLNGTTVAGSQRTVTRKNQMPDCNRVIGYQGCMVAGLYRQNGRRYRVAHGETYFDAENCRTCECRDGNGTALCSSSGNCTLMTGRGSPANCQLTDGSEVLHGMQTEAGCETCGCRNGKLRCTRKRSICKTNTRDACDRCKDETNRQVCGPDGRNHLTICGAVECAGIPAVELQEGACQSQNACEDYPCGEDEVCINKKGTVACMGRSGCTSEQLRTCLNVLEISCPVVNTTTTTTATTLEESGSGEGDEIGAEETEDTDSTQVCGTDGVTYRSICHLIQTTTGIQVLYAGECNATDCNQGQVCGTDGFTYTNLCELQNQAAVRLHYPGECLESGSDLCSRVAASNRCTVTAENCDVLVIVPDSCCPVCGGGIELVIDVDALTDASETNPDFSTVDAFTVSLLDVTALQNVDSRCTIQATLNDVGNLLVIIEAMSRSDSSYCNQATQLIESLISETNTTTSPGARRKRQTMDESDLPQAYAFVMAASVASNVDAQAQTTTASITGTNRDTVPMPMGGVMAVLVMLVLVLARLVG